MNEKIEKNPIYLPPFKRFCMTIGELPTSYVETMSYYEMILWFTKYLGEKVIPAIDNNAEALKEVQNLFLELQEYVNNYFDDLNIQTQINNKLDDMAEAGQLAEIISLYLNTQAVIGFDTVSDMSDAENLVNGSICRTLGNTTYNDGKGAFYKVRTKTNDDTIDNDLIVSLDVSESLIAEKMIPAIKGRKVIIVGDSYANRTNSWADRLKVALNLTDSECQIRKYSGVGFFTTVDSKTFSTLVVDNITINPTEVTDIIVCGGYNDRTVSETNLSDAFDTFVTTCKTNYPNATIHVGFISWCRPEIGNETEYSTIVASLNFTKNRYIQNCSKYPNVHYLNNVEYAIHYLPYVDSSYFHPTADGQAKICELVKQAFETGSCNLNTTQVAVTNSLVKESYIDSVSYAYSTGGGLYSSIANNLSRLFANGSMYLDFDETTSFDLSQVITIGTLLDGYVQGRNRWVVKCEVNARVITSNNGAFIVPATLYMSDGILKLMARVENRTGTAWVKDTLVGIDINGVDLRCDSMLQY